MSDDARTSLSSDVQVLLTHGRQARSSGDITAAAIAFGKAARLQPDRPEPAFAQCLVFLEQAAPEAGDLVQRLLVRFPDHASGWLEIGQYLLRAGKTEAALACFRRAAASGADFASAMGCGTALRGLGRLQPASEAFAEAGRLNPRSDRACFMLGLCAQDANDLPRARDAYRRALVLNPELAEASVNLGTVLQGMGDLDAAKCAYGAAIRMRPDTFGRVSQAMTTSPRGELWLDLGRLRRHLAG